MKKLLLQAGCHPFTSTELHTMNRTTNSPLLSAILRGCALVNDTSVPLYVDIIDSDKEKDSKETDSGAVLYIVAVLVFYSAGIVTMIIKYLKREKREMEEEKALDDFFRSMPAYKKEREQNKVNRVAIHAFHALTSLSYDDGDDDNASTDEEEARFFTETIHEVDDDNHETNLSSESDKLDIAIKPLKKEDATNEIKLTRERAVDVM